jgi:predicted small secreted protein
MSIRMAYPLLRSEGCSNAAVAKRSCSGSSLEDWEVHVEVIRSENIVLFWLFIVSYFSIQPHWSNGKHSEETKSRSSFTRYRFTWRQMKRKTLPLWALLLAVLTLEGCATTRGIGEDLQDLGRALKKAVSGTAGAGLSQRPVSGGQSPCCDEGSY